MRNKIIAALIAGGLLVGAAFVASAVSTPGTASAHEGEGQDSYGFIPRALEFLGGVLDELVGEGTISQDDADAVLDAVEEELNEIKEQREEIRALIEEFLEDGVITEDEASQLPEDHPLLGEQFDEAWADGELTVEEIRRIRHAPLRHAFRHGARLGALLDDGGIDQAEYDSLPDDHPLKQVDVSEYLEDGVITFDELREIKQQFDGDTDA